MKPVPFEEQNLTFAENQPQYQPLPAFVDREQGSAIFCWELSWRERLKLLFTGKLWHYVLTFNSPLQPVQMLVDNPFAAAKVEGRRLAKELGLEALEEFDRLVAIRKELLRQRIKEAKAKAREKCK